MNLPDLIEEELSYARTKHLYLLNINIAISIPASESCIIERPNISILLVIVPSQCAIEVDIFRSNPGSRSRIVTPGGKLEDAKNYCS